MNFSIYSFLFFVSLSIVTISASGQKYILPNEIAILSFNTPNGKKMTLSKDRGNKYIIYRFGTKNNIELQYADTSKIKWTNFKYSFWLRGGLIQNEGIDLNYLSFTSKNFKYIIYDTYFAAGQKKNAGIKIVNLKTNKVANIKGDIKTELGTLVGFRTNGLVEVGEELYD